MVAFVGRAGELTEIDSLVATVASGSRGTSVVAISGEAGVGKSRLLAEALADTSKPARAAVDLVRMTGYEPELAVPLASAQPLLRTMLADHALEPRERIALFEAAHRAMAGHEKPILVVLDDLQWVDEHSAALLHYLARGAVAEGIPFGMVMATRPSSRSGSFLSSLGRLLGPAVRMLELEPLDAGEATELARRLGATGNARSISSRSGGVPFWIEVLARDAERGADRGGVDDARDVVADRLSTVSADAIELAALLAVAGRPLATADAGSVLGWSAGRVREALAELTAAGISRASLGGARLVHDLVREAIEGEIADSTRVRLHRALAARLESAAGADALLLWEALEHRAAAREPDVALALRIATAPNRRLLGAAALGELARLADDAGSSTGRTPGTLIALHLAVAGLATELGAHELALGRWQHVVDQHPDRAVKASAALAGCREATVLRDGRRARSLLSAARRHIEGGADPRHAIVADAIEAGVVRWLEGNLEGARAPATRALAAARQLGAAADLDAGALDAYLNALQAASDGAMAGMRRAEMLELAREMREVAASSSDPAVRLHASWQSGVAANMSGRLHDAEGFLRPVWSEAGRLVLPGLRAEAGYWLGYTLLDLGLVAEARAILRETSDLLDRTGGQLRFNNQVALPLGIAEIVDGDWQDGLRRLESHASAIDDPHVRLRVRSGLATWLGRLRGPQAAAAVRATIESVLGDATAAGCRRCTQEAEVLCADAAATVDELELAADGLRRWEALRPVEANLFERVHATRARALVERTRSARRDLDSAIREAVAADQRLEAAWSLITAADIGTADGLKGRRASLMEAAALAAATGMTTIDSIARQRARALGIRTWRRPSGRAAATGAPAALTARELEVAGHIASGESNAEIATALFLSPRTVDRHVENILRKLGVANRAAMVATLRMGSPADDRVLGDR